MLEHFYDKKVGYSNAIQVELDGVTFYSHGMKELYYVTCHFATYVTLEGMGGKQTRVCPQDRKVTFQYPQTVHDHFYYRESFDNHNRSRIFLHT